MSMAMYSRRSSGNLPEHRPENLFRGLQSGAGPVDTLLRHFGFTSPQAIEHQIDNGRGIERQNLADDQSANDGVAKRLAQLGTRALPEHQRQPAEDRTDG